MNVLLQKFNFRYVKHLSINSRILLKKSDTRIPRIELEEIGPHADLVCRRNKLASEDLFKQACKKPKALKVIFLYINVIDMEDIDI